MKVIDSIFSFKKLPASEIKKQQEYFNAKLFLNSNNTDSGLNINRNDNSLALSNSFIQLQEKLKVWSQEILSSFLLRHFSNGCNNYKYIIYHIKLDLTFQLFYILYLKRQRLAEI